MRVRTFGRSLRFLALAPSLLVACSDDPVRVNPDPAGTVEMVRVYVTPPGGIEAAYTFEPAAAPHEVTVAEGENAVRVEWLDHDEHVVAELDGFRLEIEDLPEGMTFTPTGDFTGTLGVAVDAGTATSRLELFHIDEGHGDFAVLVSFVVDAGGET